MKVITFLTTVSAIIVLLFLIAIITVTSDNVILNFIWGVFDWIFYGPFMYSMVIIVFLINVISFVKDRTRQKGKLLFISAASMMVLFGSVFIILLQFAQAMSDFD